MAEYSKGGVIMQFCEVCGGILIPRKGKNGLEMVCRNCNAVYPLNSDELKILKKHSEKSNTLINVAEKKDSALPITTAICSKCGHNKAYWWLQQTRSSDEPETRFFKCVKCGNVWREYD